MTKDWELIETFTSAAGLECAVVLQTRPTCSWYCGYVAVPNNHPALFATELQCHGGVTYAGNDYVFEKEQSLIGFDMAHAGDDISCNKPTEELTAYVKAELESLAKQITTYVPPEKGLADLKNKLWNFMEETLDEEGSDKLNLEATLHYTNARSYVTLAIASLDLACITNKKD